MPTAMTGNDAAPAQAGVQEHCFADASALMDALAAAVAWQLKRALAAGREASLVVPGGRTPVPLFERLAQAPLHWDKVHITLTDERVVPPDAAASNERLVREHLLRGAAAAARLSGWMCAAGDANSQLAQSWRQVSRLPRPFDVVVLGMGDDGHVASLFPQAPGLAQALDLARPAGCVAMQAPVPPHGRVSLNLTALTNTRLILLPLVGAVKCTVWRHAHEPGSALDLPVRALLRQSRAPLVVYTACA